MTTNDKTVENGFTRREALAGIGGVAAGAALASGGVLSSAMAAETGSRAVKKEIDGKMTTTISLDWNEVYYTNCPLISASNVDQELGWTAEEFGKIGVKYAYFRSVPETDWYPHYIHNQENLIRFGGLFPPIHVNADYRKTRMLGLTHVPYEGGCMMVRAKDKIFRMSDLKGKKIGITKSLNTLKNDWWRIQEHQGILTMLMINGMTAKDVQLVDFPYPDDWYDDPAMLKPLINPSFWQLNRDHKHDLAFRPLETALLEGKVDAIYTQSGPLQQLQEATGELAAIEDLSKHPDWRLQVANIPAIITCTELMANEHPELVVAFHEGHDQGRALVQRAQACCCSDPQQANLLPGRRGYLPGHQARRHGAQPVSAEPGHGEHRQGVHA